MYDLRYWHTCFSCHPFQQWEASLWWVTEMGRTLWSVLKTPQSLSNNLSTNSSMGGGMNPLYSKWFDTFGLMESQLVGSLSEFQSGWFNIGIRNQVIILEGFRTLSDTVGQWDSDSSSSSKASCLQLGQHSMRLRKLFRTNYRERYNSAWGKPESNLLYMAEAEGFYTWRARIK